MCGRGPRFKASEGSYAKPRCIFSYPQKLATYYGQERSICISSAEGLDVWDYRDELVRSNANLAEINADLEDTDALAVHEWRRKWKLPR